MSADNGIYILETLGEYRVAERQCIDNLYWHATCCYNPSICKIIDDVDFFYHDKCINCGQIDVEYERRDDINLSVVYDYFQDCKVFTDRLSALEEAHRLLLETSMCECGIQTINVLKNIPFPTEYKEKENE